MSPKSFFDKIDRLSVNRKSTYEKLDPANIMDDDDGDLDCSTLVDPTARRSKPDSIPSINFDRICKLNIYFDCSSDFPLFLSLLLRLLISRYGLLTFPFPFDC